ncbi:unnamed protein product [Prorocentrum cordatum]|uniref:Uncharacterized protein n=1 Tax=Prorocentrum cordatum TaxID=2364126 RepID=A0ABN9RPG7_9DINO|nr:unnamed protein product [Polarella glacialis]
MVQRSASKLDSDGLKQFETVIEQRAAQSGKSLIKYSEEKNTQKATLDKKRVTEYVDFIKAIQDAVPNMSITSGDAKKCLGSVFDNHKADWNVKDAHREDWINTMELRIRNLCASVKKATSVKKPAKWLVDLGLATSPCPTADDEDDDESGTGKDDYTVVKGKAKEELSLPINTSNVAKLSSDDPIVAEWHDGYTKEINDMTKERWENLTKASHAKSGEGPLWEEESSITRNKLYIDQRVDRHLLMSLYEQGSQILMMRLDTFADLKGRNQRLPNNHEAVLTGLSIMKPIAEQYRTGNIKQGDRTALREARNKAITEWKSKGELKKVHGKDSSTVTSPTKTEGRDSHVALKRPAASEDAATPPSKRRPAASTPKCGDAAIPQKPIAPSASASSEAHLAAMTAWLGSAADCGPPRRSCAQIFQDAEHSASD